MEHRLKRLHRHNDNGYHVETYYTTKGIKLQKMDKLIIYYNKDGNIIRKEFYKDGKLIGNEC